MHFIDKIFPANFGCLVFLQSHAKLFNNAKSNIENIGSPKSTSSTKGPTLFEIPNDLLIHQIFAQLNVQDICRLKRVCRRLNTICADNSQFLPRQNVPLVMVRCGQWRDVLKGRRINHSSDILTTIEFTMIPFRGGNSVVFNRKQSHLQIAYGQLIEHFEIDVVLIDVQLLNGDTIERLQLERMAAKHLLIDFSLCSCWLIRHHFRKIIEQLGINEFARSIHIVFDRRKEFVREMVEDVMDKRISIAFLQ
ncbi:hypothetical protein GPALN_004624 [Globodera pallida]|nr:hypothetical protein GPALN_004624 [Globodera pallida]